jgi:hypothetical protein
LAASAKGHEKLVKLLLRKCAEAKAESHIYDNALKAASVHGYEEVVELLDRYASVNAQRSTSLCVFAKILVRKQRCNPTDVISTITNALSGIPTNNLTEHALVSVNQSSGCNRMSALSICINIILRTSYRKFAYGSSSRWGKRFTYKQRSDF